jgi:hypothetical protein
MNENLYHDARKRIEPLSYALGDTVHSFVRATMRNAVELLRYGTDSSLDEYQNEISYVIEPENRLALMCVESHDTDAVKRSAQSEWDGYDAIYRQLTPFELSLLHDISDVWSAVDNSVSDDDDEVNTAYALMIEIAMRRIEENAQ